MCVCASACVCVCVHVRVCACVCVCARMHVCVMSLRWQLGDHAVTEEDHSISLFAQKCHVLLC